MKYRKKPVVIEAIQFEDTTECLMLLDGLGLGVVVDYAEKDHPTLKIGTLEGTMIANIGDWVIKEPFPTDDRKFYPCKPDIFAATYELVDE